MSKYIKAEIEGKWEKTYRVTESVLNLSLVLHIWILLSNDGFFRLGQVLFWSLEEFCNGPIATDVIFKEPKACIIHFQDNHLDINS